MSPDPHESNNPPAEAKGSINPWAFIPILYFLQAVPVTIVQELAPVIYKDLGIPDGEILRWTALIALPWGLQMFFGPLVELSAAKRSWIVAGQMVLTAFLAIVPFALGLPNAFNISLLILGAAAITSALVNTAQDGYYLLAMPGKDMQAAFAGVQGTFYKLGRLFVMGILVIIAGRLMGFSEAKVETSGNLYFGVKKADGKIEYLSRATVHVQQGQLVTEKGLPLDPVVEIPGTADRYLIKGGRVLAYAGEKEVLSKDLGLWQLNPLAKPDAKPEDSAMEKVGEVMSGSIKSTEAKRKLGASTAWFVTMLACAVIYGLGAFYNRFSLPKPDKDIVPPTATKHEIRQNLKRTGAILGFYAASYFSLSGVWKLMANLVGSSQGKKGWILPEKGLFVGFDFNLSGVQAEMLQLAIALPLAIAAFFAIGRLVKGTEMGDAIASYFRLPGIFAILMFMLFYRFAESMVARTTPLFLKAPLSEGGLALTNDQLGLIKGTIGLLGIIAGGILGGWFISKRGLKKSLWTLALAMHIPIALYWLISLDGVRNGVSMPVVAFVEFIDQFGYGFGFAGYMVYMMQVAQRGKYQTIYYAMGTGLAATFIMLSGIVSGILRDSYNYHGFFVGAMILAIPGLIVLRFIPIDPEKETAPEPAAA